MSRLRARRLKRVDRRIDAMTFAPAVTNAAFERFRQTGELPGHRRLAAAVCRRALRGGRDQQGLHVEDIEAVIANFGRSANDEGSPEPARDPLRAYLFNEAVHDLDFVRLAARTALKILVGMGRDVTDPDFVDPSVPLPEFGTVGLYLLGFPEFLIKAPYKRQVRRLLDRYAVLRGQIDRSDDRWSEDLAKSWVSFVDEGALPDDELTRDMVLANAELTGFLAHYCGYGDAELMAVCDDVARLRGEARAVAIKRVQAMVAESGTEWIKRESVNRNKFAFGGEQIVKMGRGDASIRSEATAEDLRVVIERHVSWIVERFKSKAAKRYPTPTILLISLSPELVLWPEVWGRIVDRCRSHLGASSFEHVYLVEVNQRLVAQLSSVAPPEGTY